MRQNSSPMFTVITRVCRRPHSLEEAVQSLLAQTCKDWEQLFLLDLSGKHREGNIVWANKQFGRYAHKARGSYCLAMDDDSHMVDKRHLAKVKQCILTKSFPECVLTRSKMRSKEYPLLPPKEVWNLDWESGERPNKWIGNGGNWVCRTDIFVEHAKSYGGPGRGGDWYFMTALIDAGVQFIKCNSVSAPGERRGYGKVFEVTQNNWWTSFVKRHSIERVTKFVWRMSNVTQASV